jgi:hypothetical protein
VSDDELQSADLSKYTLPEGQSQALVPQVIGEAPGRFQPGTKLGRPKGSRGKRYVEVEKVCRKLVEDPGYQAKFKQRLEDGSLPPALEAMAWYYAYGKPRERVSLEGEGGGPVLVRFVDAG